MQITFTISSDNIAQLTVTTTLLSTVCPDWAKFRLLGALFCFLGAFFCLSEHFFQKNGSIITQISSKLWLLFVFKLPNFDQ
jgi:hypothetical protein